MRKRNYLFVCFLIVVLSGCDDKHIHHGYRYNTEVNVDWEGTEKVDDQNVGTTIVIRDSDGNETTIPGGNGIDAVPIELDDGKYTVVVIDDVEGVSYNDNQVTVDTNEDGSVTEPPFFSGGESHITVDKGGVTEGGNLVMYRQTRELIVKIRIISGLKHFCDIEAFNGIFNGVTLSRDLLYAFPPAENPGRPLSQPTYGKLNMEFGSIKDSSDEDAIFTYQAQYRLLGVGPDNPKTITFSYKPEDVQDGDNAVFYVLDVTDMIADFHTLEEIDSPYVLIVDLLEDPSTGDFSIDDWLVGDINDLIAGEK